jgi:3-methyladenine DNA glycosylase/8-oxoguanine DNA glycosylase
VSQPPVSIFDDGGPEAALTAAAAELARLDPVMAGLIEVHGPCRLGHRRGQRTHFAALVESVVYQQLAGTAARAIYGRLADLLGGTPTPEAVLAAGEESLRGVGLSGSKAGCILALAGAAQTGELGLDKAEALSDEELVVRLSSVRGIGRWTAEMFLMFQLGRIDVWPVGDYGVRKGYARAYGLAELPTPKTLADLGEPLRPYRSVAAWYCWRAAETTLPGGRA